MAWLAGYSCCRFKVNGLWPLLLVCSWKAVPSPFDKILANLFQLGHSALERSGCFRCPVTFIHLPLSKWVLHGIYMTAFSINTLLLFKFTGIHSISLRDRRHGLCKKETNLHNLASDSLSLSGLARRISPAPIMPASTLHNIYPNTYFWPASFYLFIFLKPYLIMNSLRAMTLAFFKISFNRHKHDFRFGVSNSTIC